MREWFVSQLPEALTESVHDVQMVINHLAKRGDIDMDHIGIFGQGSGATIAILSAAVEPRIHAVDALQPWGDWPTWLASSSLIPENERAAYLKPAFLASVAPLDPLKWLPQLGSRDIRLQFVLDDLITPAVAVQAMKAVVTRRDQVVEYDTKREQYNALAGGKTFDWIKKQLRPSEQSSDNARAADLAPATQ
jgi:cephalosporin-C deacetylase-like acetyl esterase